MNLRPSSRQSGVALVTTMIVVAVLAVVAVAFMQSTSVDRLSSRTAANYAQSRLAADAGAAAAEALVADLVRRYPDSVTVWQNIGSGGVAGTNNEATVLYVRAQSADTNFGARPGQFGGEVTLLARPLVSGASLVPVGSVAGTMTFAANNTNMVNLNATNAARPRPFIGRRSATNAGTPVTAAQWVYLTNAAGQTNGRYAFWIEDESFKVNINAVTNGARLTNSPGLGPTELRLDGSWGSSANSALRSADFAEVIRARNGLPGSNFPTALTAALAADITDTAAADELKFLTTAYSAGLDLSRGGFKRFNVNSVGFNNITTNALTPLNSSDAGQVRANLNRVIAAITNSNSVPNIGQRFYRLATNAAGINAAAAVTGEHAQIYLQKIAANLLDYIDQDDQPTYVNNDESFSVRKGPPDLIDTTIFNPGDGGEGTNRMAAMGVEVRPFLFGYALGVQLTNMTPAGFQTAESGGPGPPEPNEAQFGMLVDHYFELWNPGTRDIVVGTGVDTNVAYLDGLFLQVFDSPGWIDRTGNVKFAEPPSKNFKANVPSGSRFPAGEVTLLTTAPRAEAATFAPSARNIVSVHSDDLDTMRSVAGVTETVFSTNSPSFPTFNRFYAVSVNAAASFDINTQFLLGTPAGIVELFPALALSPDRIWAREANAFFTNRTTLFGNLRGGNPDGPAPRSTEGDPRSVMEQLSLQPIADGSTNNPNQTRFFADSNSPVGTANVAYVRPTEWVDYSSFSPGASNAPMIVRNSSFSSIGELGHLVDAARVPGLRGSLSNVIYSRSGGRTLRIGQPEHPRWYDGNQNNASRTWTSWRLADIFTTTTGSTNGASLDPQGHLTNRLGVVRGRTNAPLTVLSIPGLVNPNGSLRDRGAALRSALQGMRMLSSPDGATNTANKQVNVTNVVNAFLARMTNTVGTGLPGGAINAYWERGEISELGIFNTNTTANSMLNPATRMDQAFDRGREELVRRSIEMMTTRGSVFTVYAIGQTMQGTNIIGTARLSRTFQLEPRFAYTNIVSAGRPPGYADDMFDPGNTEAVAGRFAAPTNYSTRTLATFYD